MTPALALVAWLACTGEVEDTALPEICHEPASYDGGSWFTDTTEEWGLEGITGSRMSSADLDGDGYPDLVVSEGNFHKRDAYDDDPDTPRYRWLLMNRAGPNGSRVFEDVSSQSGLFDTRDGQGGHSASIHVFGDVDNDGDLDAAAGVFVDQNNIANDPGDRSEIYLNQGDGTFALGPRGDLDIDIGYSTSGLSWTDGDLDGNLDLWVVGWYETYGYLYAEQDRLMRGDGSGGMVDVTEDVGLKMERGGASSLDPWLEGTATRPGYGATVCDLDGDGGGELLATNYGRAWNQQWKNEGGQFTEMGQASGFAGDANLDYSDNQFYRCYCEYKGPCDPDPGAASLADCETYADYWQAGWDDQPARLNGNSFTTACGDVDADGDLDLVTAEIVHWHVGSNSDPTELLLNDGTGSFVRPGNEASGLTRDHESADWNEGDITTALFDFDNDGRQDIFVGSSDYPDTRVLLYHQQESGAFEEIAEAADIGWPLPAGVTVADFDRDGDLDVIVGSSTMRVNTHEDHQVHLFENQGGGNHARLLLRGRSANRSGIGAAVTVTTGTGAQLFEVSGGYGHFGLQNDLAVHAGLADACTYDVEVRWPGGDISSYTDLMANHEVVLDQDGSHSYNPL